MTKPNRSEEHKRGYYAVVLVAGVALSVAGNALHAHSVTGGSVLASVGAAVFPLLLLMMTELTVLTAKRFGGWVRAVTAGLAAVVAVISFAISYEALAYAARELFGIERHLAWLAPLTVDLPIIGATLALWAASDLIRRDQAVVANEPAAPVADDRPMPVVPPVTTTVADRPSPAMTVVGDSAAPTSHSTTTGAEAAAVGDSVGDPVGDSADSVVGSVGDSGEPPQVSGGVAESTGESTIHHQQPVAKAPAAVDETAATNQSPTAPTAAITHPVAESPTMAAGPAAVADQPLESAAPVDESTIELARAVHAATGTIKPVEVVAEVLRLTAAGESQRAVADAVGVDRTLVRKWRASGEELADATRQPHGRHSHTLVESVL
ncbi:hypothetical protein GCM10027169_00310 [Gordonia jinhuaensis]|uniref:DUF2637 domain-containing protein n=1 Tax=Gordonia jinhuaensis TaxID=1517702 RepID=A0A916SVT3_9ACTN|nr:helix-turn-helix domain-containing protein [Gordonia jinhuaensis]GGB18310.1 hypothetical protein GCM10011489_02970 [Gordonia jinhuaensis]